MKAKQSQLAILLLIAICGLADQCRTSLAPMEKGNIKFISRSRILRRIQNQDLMNESGFSLGLVSEKGMDGERGLADVEKEQNTTKLNAKAMGKDRNRELHMWDQKRAKRHFFSIDSKNGQSFI